MADVTLRSLPGCTRWVLRCAPDVAATLPLPQQMLRAQEDGARAALRLGPDEWLLLAEEGATPDAWPPVVDVSHGRIALELAGVDAAAALNEGCALDLSEAAFPVGMCTRTLFGKVEILLWRRGPALWRVEVARSFGDYLQAFLAEAIQDFD